MDKIRIAIDPDLVQAHGPEVHWTWRLLLTSIGYTWEEVPPGSACDIAYTGDPARALQARLCIRANPAAWQQPAVYRLDRVERYDGLSYPVFSTDNGPLVLYDDAGRLVCQRDLVFDVFWLATGQEERHWKKDKHGFFDLTGTAVQNHQVLHQAIASQIILWLETTLGELGCPPHKPRWPDGKQAAAAVGHDVDYPEVKRWLEPLRILKRQGTRGIGSALDVLLGRRTHWQFAAWVEMEKKLQTRSAFYFVPREGSLLEYAGGVPDPFYDVMDKSFRQLFRYLAAEGFEVGLHPSYLAYQSTEKFAEEKQRLEEASGQPVVGNRHHYWHLNPANAEETLLIHEQVGLKYDTSLIHNRYLGWRRGLSQPYFPFHHGKQRELKTLQIPTAWMDDQVFGLQADNPGNRMELLYHLADRVVTQKGCLLIDIHDYVFDDKLFPGWAQAFHDLWQYLSGRGDIWFGTPAEIAQHWSARYKSLVEASQGLDKGLQ